MRVADSESQSSSGSPSDAEQAESVGRHPSMSASVSDSSQQTSLAAVCENYETPQSSDVTPVNSQLQVTDSTTADQSTITLTECESDVKPESCTTRTDDVDTQHDAADTCVPEISKPSVAESSMEHSHEGKKYSPDSDVSHAVNVAKEVVGDVESVVKTRGKSRAGGRTVSSNVDAVADLEGSGVESAPEAGKMKPSVEDKTKTPRVKKKNTDEDNSDKTEKKGKADARKLAREDKTVDDDSSNDEDVKITAKVKEEEDSQKSKVTDIKENVDKPELESNSQKGKGKDNRDQKSLKSHSTRKGSLSVTGDSASREKRSRAQADKIDLCEVAEMGVGRGRRKMRLGVQPVIILSEAENSQEPEQYSVCESSDSASTKLDSNTMKHDIAESSSFECLNTADEFAQRISDVGLAKDQCFKAADVCENSSSETTNSGAAAGGEHMSRADVASLLNAVFTDSPAYTSADELGPIGGSSSSSAGGTGSLSPAADVDEEHTSTKSELEANMEVAAYMGAGSTNECELSSDEDDDDSSSMNTLSRKTSVKSSSCTVKRKSDDGTFQHSSKRRRREKQHRTRSHHASTAAKPYSYRNDGNVCLILLGYFIWTESVVHGNHLYFSVPACMSVILVSCYIYVHAVC